MSKPAVGVSAVIVVAAVVAAYLTRTDAFALIAWIVIAVLAAGAVGVVMGFDQTVRHMRERRSRHRIAGANDSGAE